MVVLMDVVVRQPLYIRRRLEVNTTDTPVGAVEGEVRSLSFRQARRKFGLSYKAWRNIKDGKASSFMPFGNGRGIASEALEAVLTSVRCAPQLNTAERAKRLGLRVEAVQKVLAAHGVSKLDARLVYAGFQVEPVRPLQAARLRRVVASQPGAYTQLDFKSFGFLRGNDRKSQRPLRGCVVVDAFTGFASVELGTRFSAELAIRALQKHQRLAPFPVRGLVLTDNGIEFTGRAFSAYCVEAGFVHRTTRAAHPWSNGKVEAVNKTLKYQCFPVLAQAGAETFDAVVNSLDEWMEYYNRRRSHTGHMNRGLPPVALYELWRETPGDPLDKLEALGLISHKDLPYLRIMGAPGNAGERPGGIRGAPAPGDGRSLVLRDEQGLPFAFVVDRAPLSCSPSGDPTRAAAPTHSCQPERAAMPGTNGGRIVLAK
jgi:transposase InsO family protein